MKQVSVDIIESNVKALKKLGKKNNISFSSLLDQIIDMAYDKSKYEIIK